MTAGVQRCDVERGRRRERRCAHRAHPGRARSPPRGEASTARKTRWPGEDRVLRVDLRAERLRDAEHDAAEQRAPERADAADHDGLEREDQLRRAAAYGSKVERMARNRPASAGDRDGDRGRARVDGARVDADELGRVGVLRPWRASRGPDGVRDRNSCRPPSTTIATTRISAPSRRDREAGRDLPARGRDRRRRCRRASARRARSLLSSRFWITIESPNVVSSGTSTPGAQAALEDRHAAARSRAASITGSTSDEREERRDVRVRRARRRSR